MEKGNYFMSVVAKPDLRGNEAREATGLDKVNEESKSKQLLLLVGKVGESAIKPVVFQPLVSSAGDVELAEVIDSSVDEFMLTKPA